MRTVSEIELTEEIAKRKEVNFIAFATTPWHALGVNATIHHLAKQNINLYGYVVIIPHQVTGLGLREDNFLLEETSDVQIVVLGGNNREGENLGRKLWRKLKGYTNELNYYISKVKNRADMRELYWAVPLKPSFQMIPKMASFKNNIWVKIILIDEGLGTYLNTDWTWTKVSFQEGGIVAGFRTSIQNMIINRFYMCRLKKRKQVQYHQLFVPEQGHLIQNHVAVDNYKYVAEKQYGGKSFEKYEEAVIINGDLLSEVGIIESDADLKVYKAVCDTFKKAGVPIILKPHPRCQNIERYMQLGCEIDQNKGIALESILAGAKRKPICIIGVDSTSLVTANILFDTRVFSICALFCEESLCKKKRFVNFKRTFSNVVEFPDTMQKLLCQIQKLVVEEGSIL